MVGAGVEIQKVGDTASPHTRSKTFPIAPPKISASPAAEGESRRSILHSIPASNNTANTETPIKDRSAGT